MTLHTPLTRRNVAPDRTLPPATPVSFAVSTDTIAPTAASPDMDHLAARVRALMGCQQGGVLQLPLGGRFFDIVVTASGLAARGVVRLMDEVQSSPKDTPDAPSCGPVIEDPRRGWLIWLVPPGTSDHWAPVRFATCLGAPHTVALPPLEQAEPPGPYWLRRMRTDRLVPPGPLREHLDQFRPGPVPHETLLGSALSTFS